MEPEAEYKIDERADDDHDEVVSISTACRNGWRRCIRAPLERDAVVDGPGQDRGEQNDRTEIAIGEEVRYRPQLHADQHRMLEHAFDLARNIGGHDHDD